MKWILQFTFQSLKIKNLVNGFPLVPYASKVRSNTKGLPLLPVLPLDDEACLCLQHLRTGRKITDSSYDCNIFFLGMSTLFSYRPGHTGKSDTDFRQSFSATLHTVLSDWIALTLVLLLLVPVEKNLWVTLWKKDFGHITC